MNTAATRWIRSLGIVAFATASGLFSQEITPTETWRLRWAARAGAGLISHENRMVSLLDEDQGLPWSLEMEGRTISYGPAAIEYWRSSPPRPHGKGSALWVEQYHRAVTAGRPLEELGRRSFAGSLVETGQVAVRDRNGLLVRKIRVLEYAAACRVERCTERKVHGFYLEGRSLWFFHEYMRRFGGASPGLVPAKQPVSYARHDHRGGRL